MSDKQEYYKEVLLNEFELHGITTSNEVAEYIAHSIALSHDMWLEMYANQHSGGESSEVLRLREKIKKMERDHSEREQGLQRAVNRSLRRDLDKHITVDKLGYIDPRGV